MYAGKKYTAIRRGALDTVYHCVHCGWTQGCIVVGVGLGEGNSAFFTDNGGAARRAEEEADQNALKNAELTLRLCPCPKCGKRNSAKFIFESTLALAGSMLLPWAVGWFISSSGGGRGSGNIGWGVFGALGLILPFILFFTMIEWRWTTAKERVAFTAEEEQTEAPRPKKKRKRRVASTARTSEAQLEAPVGPSEVTRERLAEAREAGLLDKDSIGAVLALIRYGIVNNGPSIKAAVPWARYRLGSYQAFLLGDVESRAEIEYPYLLAVFADTLAEPLVVVSSEAKTIALGHGSHFLVVTHGAEGIRANCGASNDWADRSKFTDKALSLAAEQLRVSEPAERVDPSA